MNPTPSHGFPGGPPTPPYGEFRQRRQSPDGPVAEDLPPPPPALAPETDEADQTLVPESASTHRRKIIRHIAVPVAAALVIAAAGSYYIRISSSENRATPDGPTQTTSPNQTQSTQPNPAQLGAPGAGTFASVSVDSCATMLGPIGASNPFPSGIMFDPATGPKLEARGILSTPAWYIDLPNDFKVTDLSSEPRPSSPGTFSGISDGTVLLFSPLNSTSDSLLGVYRVANGELVWSTKIPRDVYVMSDTKYLYLIDHRSPSVTTIAVVAPSRAQIVGCFSATGGTTGEVSPLNRTALAADGVLYVVFSQNGDGARVEALSESTSRTVLDREAFPMALHGILKGTNSPLLLVSTGTQADLAVVAYNLNSSSVEFTLTSEILRAAPQAEVRSLSPSAELSPVLAEAQNPVPFEIRNVLFAGTHATLLFGTNSQDLLMVSLSSSGEALWKLAVRPETETGLGITAKSLHIAPTGPPPNSGSRTALILDLDTGKLMGRVQNMRWASGLGTGPMVHSVWGEENNEFLHVYNDAEVVAGIGGKEANTAEPLVASPVAVVVYAEVSGRRVVAAYVLDPNAVEAPTT